MQAQVLVGIVAAPGLTFLLLSLVWLLGWTPRERTVARITAPVYSLMAVSGIWLIYAMMRDSAAEVRVFFGDWLAVGEYHFSLELAADHLSAPLVLLTVVLLGLVGSFSVRYLHRERGYFRFFLLMNLFAFGALLVFTAGSFDLLLGGWELVGITSVLLIAFFDERREPVRNAIRVFSMYRVADLGLLLGIFFMHRFGHSARIAELFPGQWPDQSSNIGGWPAALVGLLLLFAAAGKSAQTPFSGWLPRAMEGPTPSSAIFYGAIAVHMGAYLLLRAEPLLANAPWAVAAVVAIGGATALLGTLAHRASSDAKTSLAYAAMAQLGVIFVEIGLGYPMLALTHMCGHAVVRTLQFLRAPSMLHDFRKVHAAAGGHLAPTGAHYHGLLPEGFRVWLYRVALERGFYDAVLDRLVAGPAMRLSRWLASFEPKIDTGHGGRPAPTAATAGQVKEIGN